MIALAFCGVVWWIFLVRNVVPALTENNNKMRDSTSPTPRFITNKMCPYAQKVWIALEAAGVSYDMEEISLYGPGGKPDWFMKLNPKGTVPVLVCCHHDDAIRLTDSDEILDQMGRGDAISGASKLVPRDKEEKIKEFRSGINDFLPIGKKAVLGGSKDKMWETLTGLDLMIDGPYVCGSEITIADCAAFPFLWRIENAFGALESKGCRNIKAWLTTCEANASFARTIQSSWWWWW